jgi:VWFA-related protein
MQNQSVIAPDDNNLPQTSVRLYIDMREIHAVRKLSNCLCNVVVVSQLLSLALAQPQTSTTLEDKTVVFKAGSELVTVPVVVTDKSGTHIHNLKKEDFELREDGKLQKISTFEEVQKTNILTPHQVPSDQFSNVLDPGPEPVNLSILVIDFLNTPFEDQVTVKNELTKYLAELGNNPQPTSILLLTRNGLRVLHDFATNPTKLSSALQKAPTEKQLVEQANQEAVPARTPPEITAEIERQRKMEQQMESVERRNAVMMTLQAMQEVAESCAGLPGRKAVLWASAGFPFTMNELSMSMNIAGPKLDSFADVSAFYEKTWKALNQAQVALYPVDVRGLTNPMKADASINNPRGEFYGHAQWMNTETIGTFQTFAQATGGRAFYNTNDLKGVFQKATDDNSAYYMLGYYLETDSKKKTGWHKLTVHIRRNDAQARARSGFFVTSVKPDTRNETALKTALGSPLNYTAIPITGHWQKIVSAKEQGKKTAIFLLTMPANFVEIDESDNDHMQLEFAAVALTETGAVAGKSFKTIDGHPKGESLNRIRSQAVDYRGDLVVPPGEYTVRFVVQDQLNGRMGSLSTHLKVEP